MQRRFLLCVKIMPFVTATMVLMILQGVLGDRSLRAAPTRSRKTSGAMDATGSSGSDSSRSVSHRPLSKRHHKISPELYRWFKYPFFRAFRGRRMPGGKKTALKMDRVAATVRLSGESDLEKLKRAEDHDMEVRVVNGKACRIGKVVTVLVTEKGLEVLKGLSFVRRVELDMAPPVKPPLDHTAAEVEAMDAWRSFAGDDLPVTGHGVLIADIDSPIDPTHPHFFRADGGYYDWIDVDGNDTLDFGIDGVDLDGNGVLDPGEELEFFDGEAWGLYTSYTPILDTDNGVFDMGWDFIYADLNENGRRDFGPAGGYTENDPSGGEPVFLVDDVNGNGKPDLGEKLIRLGTSKIRAVFDGNNEYRRGENLMDVPVDEWSLHGTGVAGILVGGSPGLTTLTGIAPDAEVLMGAYGVDPYISTSTLFYWAVQEGADLVLHEYAPWTGTHMDGSTNMEASMDQVSAEGVAQITPSGNLGGCKKHMNVELQPGFDERIPVIVPTDSPYGSEFSYVNLTYHWRETGRDLVFTLETPGGQSISLGTDGDYVTLPDGTTVVHAERDDSARGTAMFDILIAGWDGANYHLIEKGEWALTVQDDVNADPGDPSIHLSGYVMDNVTSWSQGVYFPEYTSEKHLICFPATADSAISVAAYTGHDAPPYSPAGGEWSGQLREYSCRGTRIDGASIMDIAAPDNPLTPINKMSYYGIDIKHGAYMVFGGTSGAGPHVAGAVALLKQLEPNLTGEEIRDRLWAGALVDDDVVGDNVHPVQDLWGAGKLRIYETLYMETKAQNTSPTVQFPAQQAYLHEEVVLAPVVGDTEDATANLQLRWDDDYDGTWNYGPHPVSEPRTMVFNTLGSMLMKVQVIDSGGMTASTLAEIEVVEAPEYLDAGVGDGGSDGTNGGGGGCSCRTAETQSGPSGSSGSLPFYLIIAFLFIVRFRYRRKIKSGL